VKPRVGHQQAERHSLKHRGATEVVRANIPERLPAPSKEEMNGARRSSSRSSHIEVVPMFTNGDDASTCHEGEIEAGRMIDIPSAWSCRDRLFMDEDAVVDSVGISVLF